MPVAWSLEPCPGYTKGPVQGTPLYWEPAYVNRVVQAWKDNGLPPNVPFFMTEGNDLDDLKHESAKPVLMRYLREDGFSQNLIGRQAEIDATMKGPLDESAYRKTSALLVPSIIDLAEVALGRAEHGIGAHDYRPGESAPTVLLVSMLPISIGGWGVREGAMVVALHGFGISAEDALLPSVLFGLCAVAATLPGGILWIINKDAVAENSGRACPEKAGTGFAKSTCSKKDRAG